MDSDSESEEHSKQVRGIPATIILINMFDPNSRKSSEQAHVATCQVLRHYLRTQSSHYLGVCLYGTDEDNTSIFVTKCVKDIFPLSLPTVENYILLEKKFDSIKQSKELVLSEVLAHCSKMFSACKKTLSTRTIVMLTALDHPPTVNDQDPTLESVVDLVDSDIQLKIINIADSDYEIDQFYKDFLFEANKGQDVALPDHVWDPEDIKKQLIIQSHRNLALSELPFEICKDVTMGVKIYKFLKSQTQPKPVYFHKDTNESVISAVKMMKCTKETDMEVDEDQKEEVKKVPLLKTEIMQCQEYGGETVEFISTEMKTLKNPFGPNVLKLLGFKPASVLQKEKWFIENCYFIFPSEEKIEGSTIVFKALYQACIEMKVVAICILRARVNSKPKIVALSPCTQPFGLNIDIGFDVIIIPFAENVRELPVIDDINEDIKITNEQRTYMNDIINDLMFEYKPEMFENPMLQSKYRLLEAKALSTETIAEMHDTTKPDPNIFVNLDEDKFHKLFGPFEVVAPKRVNESKPSTSQKKAKTDQLIDQDLLKENIANQKIDKQYTVEQLKQILRSLNVTTLPKKKDELVKLVYENYA